MASPGTTEALALEETLILAYPDQSEVEKRIATFDTAPLRWQKKAAPEAAGRSAGSAGRGGSAPMDAFLSVKLHVCGLEWDCASPLLNFLLYPHLCKSYFYRKEIPGVVNSVWRSRWLFI